MYLQGALLQAAAHLCTEIMAWSVFQHCFCTIGTILWAPAYYTYHAFSLSLSPKRNISLRGYKSGLIYLQFFQNLPIRSEGGTVSSYSLFIRLTLLHLLQGSLDSSYLISAKNPLKIASERLKFALRLKGRFTVKYNHCIRWVTALFYVSKLTTCVYFGFLN